MSIDRGITGIEDTKLSETGIFVAPPIISDIASSMFSKISAIVALTIRKSSILLISSK